MEVDIWRYRDASYAGTDITGFGVEALDGSIGKIDKATDDTTGNTLVVDTGPWIFGKKVMLPGGVIDRIDGTRRRSTSTARRTRSRTRPSTTTRCTTMTPTAAQLAGYYGPGGRGYRDWPLA